MSGWVWDGKSEKLIAVIQRNHREQVHIYLKVYEGHPIIDMRVWYEDRNTGEWRPTMKGFAVSTGLYDDLVTAVESLGPHIEANPGPVRDA